MTPSRRLEALLRPRAVCVVGASAVPDSPQYRFFRHLLDSRVEVFPVTRRYAEIDGVKTYASIADLPKRIDQAILLIPSQHVEAAVRDAIGRGASSVVVVSGGFAEGSEAGRAAQGRLARICDEAGVALLGPNCYGYVNNVDDIRASGAAWLDAGRFPVGGIGVASQSGGLGIAIMPWLIRQLGGGFSHIVNVGNQAHIDLADTLDFLADDPSTNTIVLMLEGVPDGRKLLQTVTKARTARKPVLFIKIGQSAAGQQAALAHTGALAGEDKVFAALMRHAGALRFSALEEIGFAAHLLERARGRRFGSRLALITVSGGVVAQAVDLLGQNERLSLAKLAQTTTDRLKQRLPAVSAIGNPVDLTIAALTDLGMFTDAAKIVLDDENMDILVVTITIAGDYDEVLRALDLVAAESRKPVILLWLGSALRGEREEILRGSGAHLPWTNSERTLMSVLNAIAEPIVDTTKKEKQSPDTAATSSRLADEIEICNWMRTLGYAVPQTLQLSGDLNGNVQELLAAAKLDFPLVVKGIVEGVAHKAKSGLLWLGIADARELMETSSTFFALHPAPSRLLLQETVAIQHELMIGYKEDPTFGSIILFGAGGVDVESRPDIAYELAPMSAEKATALIHATEIGRELADAAVEKLANVIVSLSTALPQGGYREVDLNPTVLTPDGGIVFIDGLGVRRDETTRSLH